MISKTIGCRCLAYFQTNPNWSGKFTSRVPKRSWFQYFSILPLPRAFFQILCQTLCMRDGMEWYGTYRYQWDSISSFHIMQTALSPRTPHGSHIKKWWKGIVPGSHEGPTQKKFEGSAPNIWPLKNGKCHDLQKVVSTAFWVLKNPSELGMSWDEVTSSWALLLDVQTSHGMPWRNGCKRSISQVGDVILKHGELMKNRDLTNKSG